MVAVRFMAVAMKINNVLVKDKNELHSISNELEVSFITLFWFFMVPVVLVWWPMSKMTKYIFDKIVGD